MHPVPIDRHTDNNAHKQTNISENEQVESIGNKYVVRGVRGRESFPQLAGGWRMRG